MEKIFHIIKILIQKRFTGVLTIEFFDGGIRSAHQQTQKEKVI